MATIEYKPSGSLGTLLFKNALLNFVTLSTYRFWAKTAVRRYFWQAIVFDGEPFEYTGLGRELLIGFLIVVAILAPMVLAWSALEAALRSDPIALAISKAFYVAVLYLLIMAAGFRARRYRLSRTRWRAIRASQSGSTWRYVLLGLAWGLVSFATLGLATPWMRTSLQRYRTTNTWLGDQRFSFDAPALPLLPRWIVVMVIAALPIAILVYSALPFIRELIGAFPGGNKAIQETIRRAPGMIVWFVFVPYLAGFIGFLAYVWYRIAEFRHFAAHTRFGSVSFRSTASGGAILGKVLLFLLAYLGCILLVLAIVAGAITAFSVAAAVGPGATPGRGLIATAVIVGLIVGIGLLFVFRLLWALIVTAGTIRHLCTTLDVSGSETLRDVKQSPAAAPKYGEGLADSFDLGAA